MCPLLQNFDFDVRQIHWPTYLENYCMGTKRFALKEDIAKMPEARRNVQRSVTFTDCEDSQTKLRNVLL